MSKISRRGKRSRDRPSRRWQADIAKKEGTTWNRKAIDRGQRKVLMEGVILQRMYKAQVKGERCEYIHVVRRHWFSLDSDYVIEKKNSYSSITT